MKTVEQYLDEILADQSFEWDEAENATVCVSLDQEQVDERIKCALVALRQQRAEILRHVDDAIQLCNEVVVWHGERTPTSVLAESAIASIARIRSSLAAHPQKQTAANPTPAAAHSTESYPSKSASNGNQEGVRHATR